MKNQISPWAWAATAFGAVVRYAPALLVLALVVALPHTASAIPALGLAFAGAIMDHTLEFCIATALNTGAAGTYLIGDVVDLVKVRNIGNGQPVFLVITVITAPTSAGAATVQFILASDSQAAIATDGSATQHFATIAIPKATLVPGYQIVIPLPLGAPDYEEFLGILQVTGTAALTAGAVSAYLTLDPPKWKAYPNSPNAI